MYANNKQQERKKMTIAVKTTQDYEETMYEVLFLFGEIKNNKLTPKELAYKLTSIAEKATALVDYLAV